jgi:molybdopterin molybdotransferase
MTYASGDGKAAFGLPGNPVSVYLTFHLHVLRAARLMSGADHTLEHVSLPLAEGFTRRKVRRMSFVPARLTVEGTLQPVEYHGSAHLLALSKSHGFFSIPSGVKELSPGDCVSFLPIVMGYP